MVRFLLRTDLRKLHQKEVRLLLSSVEGFSLDYLILNISGYIFYVIYSNVGYFTDLKGAGTVVIGDLIFVYHALLMVAIQIIQCLIYPVSIT